MSNDQIIKECFAGLSQFNQPADPSYPRIADSLTQSETGRVINKVHPLLRAENLFTVAPEFSAYQYTNWIIGIAIVKGTTYAHNGLLFEALENISIGNNTATPPESDKFEPTNPFSGWLKEIRDQTSIDLVSLLIRHKKLNGMSKSILENTSLYEGGGLFTDREIKSGRFVGYEVELSRNQNVVVTIDKLGLQLDGVVSDLDIYLYHSSRNEPIAIQKFSGDGGLTFSWQKTEGFLMRASGYDSGYDVGGFFYLGYYESDLNQLQAISKKFDISKPCTSCNRYNGEAFRTWSRRFSLRAFYIDADDINLNKKLFDVSKINYVTDRNFGINFNINVACDTYNFFCDNRLLFADSYNKLLAVNLLKEIAYTTRINGVAEMMKAEAASELDPKTNSGSMLDEFNKSLKAVDYDFSGLDRDCLPCLNKHSIKYGAI